MPGRASPPARIAFFAGKTPGQPPTPAAAVNWYPYPANPGNTGYQNAGAVLGGGPYTSANLANGNGLSLADNTTYSLYNFSGNPAIGTSNFASGNSATGVTFTGCRFASNNVSDANVNAVGSHITYRYCTFEPSTVSAGSEPAITNTTYAIANGSGYQYGINQVNGSSPVTMDHCRMWGFANAVQLASSTVANPFTITYCLFQNPRADGGTDHTDGPGQLNGLTGINGLVIENNTIIGLGNTNGLALQAGTYNTATITGNYFAGYGYTVAIGTVTGNQVNITFANNIWGSDANLEPGGNGDQPNGGPLYSGSQGSFGSGAHTSYGNLWQGNKILTAAGTQWMAAGNNGLYWWPSDGNPSNSSSVIGHASDYVNS